MGSYTLWVLIKLQPPTGSVQHLIHEPHGMTQLVLLQVML